MSFQRIVQFSKLLESRGYNEEAKCLLVVLSHYVPEGKDDVPSFWRSNHDYGEGFYHGDMSEKGPLKEWLKKRRKKK